MSGASTAAPLFTQRVVIGVGDLAVSNNAQIVLSTYALGSCVGVVAYDPGTKAGGILHLMLPESAISPQRASNQPALFADTGLAQLMRALAGLKVERNRLRIFVAGGASVINGHDPFRIGERNTQATLGFLAQNGLIVRHSDLGGTINRTLHLQMNTGEITLKRPSATQQYALAG